MPRAMLKPDVVHDGRTSRIPHVTHRSEIQSLALFDPMSKEASGTRQKNDGMYGGGGGGGEEGGKRNDVRLASVDATGRAFVTTLGRDWMSDADMASFASSSSSQYALEPYEHGWGQRWEERGSTSGEKFITGEKIYNNIGAPN